MAIQFHKVTALPATPAANAIYFVQNGTEFDLFVTKTDGTAVPMRLPAGATVADASSTVRGIIELATNAEAQAGTDALRAVTPASLASVTATATRAGLIELATQAEVNAGTDTLRGVTPATLATYVSANSSGGLPLANYNETGTFSFTGGGTQVINTGAPNSNARFVWFGQSASYGTFKEFSIEIGGTYEVLRTQPALSMGETFIIKNNILYVRDASKGIYLRERSVAGWTGRFRFNGNQDKNASWGDLS